MTNILANMTQVLMNSPTVSSLVAAGAAAAETAKRQAQIEESLKFQNVLQKTVLAPEKGASAGKQTEAQLKQAVEDERSKKKTAYRHARPPKKATEDGSNPDSAATRDPEAVVDICV